MDKGRIKHTEERVSENRHAKTCKKTKENVGSCSLSGKKTWFEKNKNIYAIFI